MSKRDALTRRELDDLVVRAEDGLARTDSRGKDLAYEGAVQLLGFLVEGGKVFLEHKRLELQSAAARDETERALAKLDAETTQKLRVMQAEMEGEREKTKKLRIMLDHLHRSGEPPDSPMSRAIAEVLRRGDLT